MRPAVVACLWLALVLGGPVIAQDAPASKPGAGAGAGAGRSVPFKTEEDFTGQLARVGVGLVIALGIGFAALAGYKRLVVPQTLAGRRLHLVETLRLGSKAVVFLVEVDGRSLLVGHVGDSLAVLERPLPQDV